MTKIYLIRHAEAEGNLYRRIQGHYNGDITIKGHKQIAYLAERFRDTHIDAVYASDLQRTQKTAGAILKYHNLPLNIEPRLKEIGMGIWEDSPWGNVSYDDPEQMLYFSNDPAKWSVERGENFYDLRARITAILTELAERHDGQTIACFSHGMAIRSFISGLKGLPSERVTEVLHGDNTCVASLSWQNGAFEIEYYNDNSHIPTEMSTFASQRWWKDKASLDFTNYRLLPMDITADEHLFTECYGDCWQSSHGTLNGYSPEPYLREAIRVSAAEPKALIKAFSGHDFAGIIELDPDRMAQEGAGWISFLYLVPEQRGHNMGVQLIGHAVSFFRRKGRKSLRLHVAEENEIALAFYKKLGFECIAEESGSLGMLKLMEMKI